MLLSIRSDVDAVRVIQLRSSSSALPQAFSYLPINAALTCAASAPAYAHA
jgi:hypothetical protein